MEESRAVAPPPGKNKRKSHSRKFKLSLIKLVKDNNQTLASIKYLVISPPPPPPPPLLVISFENYKPMAYNWDFTVFQYRHTDSFTKELHMLTCLHSLLTFSFILHRVIVISSLFCFIIVMVMTSAIIVII